MVEVVLTKDQARLITEADRDVVLRGPDGKILGYVSPESAEMIEKIQSRRKEPHDWFTTAQVLEHLRSKESA